MFIHICKLFKEWIIPTQGIGAFKSSIVIFLPVYSYLIMPFAANGFICFQNDLFRMFLQQIHNLVCLQIHGLKTSQKMLF